MTRINKSYDKGTEGILHRQYLNDIINRQSLKHWLLKQNQNLKFKQLNCHSYQKLYLQLKQSLS